MRACHALQAPRQRLAQAGLMVSHGGAGSCQRAKTRGDGAGNVDLRGDAHLDDCDHDQLSTLGLRRVAL